MTKRFLVLFCFILTIVVIQAKENEPIETLIITGQNNHNWESSSVILKQILDQTGMFQTAIAKSPAKGADMDSFCPDFSKYQLLVIDYNGDPWTEKVRSGFQDFVHEGGGVVIYHAADNAFSDWKEYNQIIGLGGWGKRSEKDGPYVYYKEGKPFIDYSPGRGGSHGKRSSFKVTNRVVNHPITKGLQAEWMHAEDELYSNLRGPAENLEILATAYSDTLSGGSGKDEPVLMTIKYGKGLIFHTVLGHCGKDDEHPALECAGFIVTFQRGSEWAATGEVKQKVPKGFPDANKVVRWKDYKME